MKFNMICIKCDNILVWSITSSAAVAEKVDLTQKSLLQ